MSERKVNMKKISLVFPVYNVADYVQSSLLSALNQTYQNIEYIIVDDVSTDNSMDIVRSILVDYNSKNVIIVSHDRNKGIGEARNTGIRHASGDYIFFMDSDDLLLHTSLECLEKVVTRTCSDAVVGSHEIIKKDVSIKDVREGVFCGKDIILEYFKEKRWNCVCWNILYRLNTIKENGLSFPSVSYSEDVCFLFKYYLNINKVVLSPEITYKYVERKGSITSSTVSENKIKDILIVYNEMVDESKKYQICDICGILTCYINNYRLNLIRLILANVKYDMNLLKESMRPILKLHEILFYSMPLFERLKHLLFLLPFLLKRNIIKYAL